MSTFRGLLEALHPRNGNGFRNQVEETNPSTGAEITNLPLLQLLQKQREQLRQQKEHLQRLMQAKEKKNEDDNSYMFEVPESQSTRLRWHP